MTTEAVQIGENLINVVGLVRDEANNKATFTRSIAERSYYHTNFSEDPRTITFDLLWQIALISDTHLQKLEALDKDSPTTLFIEKLSEIYQDISTDYEANYTIAKALEQYRLEYYYGKDKVRSYVRSGLDNKINGCKLPKDDRAFAYLDGDLELSKKKLENEKKRIEVSLAKLREQINKLAISLNQQTLIVEENNSYQLKSLQTDEFELEKNKIARDDLIKSVSYWTGTFVATGEAFVAMFGIAALGLTGPLSIPLLILVFVSAFVCNKILLSSYTYDVLHLFLDKKKLAAEGDEVRLIYIDSAGNEISSTRRNVIYGCLIFAVAAGILYAALSGVAIVTLLTSMGTPFGLALALAAIPVLFTKIGISALFFKGIAKFIADFDGNAMLTSVSQFFWPTYLEFLYNHGHLTTRDKAWYVIDLLFRSLLKVTNIALNTVVLAGMSILFFGKINSLSQSMFGDSKVFDYIGYGLTGLNTVFSFIFGLQQVESSMAGITLCHVLAAVTRLLLVLPIVSICLVGTIFRALFNLAFSSCMHRIDVWQEAPECLTDTYKNAYSIWREAGAPGTNYAPEKILQTGKVKNLTLDAETFRLEQGDLRKLQTAISRLNQKNAIQSKHSFWHGLARVATLSSTFPNGTGQACLTVLSAHQQIGQLLSFALPDNVIKLLLFVSEFCYSSVPNYQATVEYFQDGTVETLNISLEQDEQGNINIYWDHLNFINASEDKEQCKLDYCEIM